MFHPRFSASAESFFSSVSSSSSASEDCECLDCEQIYPLHRTLLSPITLQKQKAQMTSMGYSKLFNLGYFSATGALQSSG